MAEARFLGYGRQSITDADIEAVIDVLRSDFLTQGPAVAAFERALAEYVGVRHAIAVSSGTAALHLACLAAGLKPGDVGVTQPVTFVASANAMAYCGAEVHLVDIDPDTLNMDPEALAAFLEAHPACRVIIPVAYGGLTGDLARLRAVAGPDRIIIEDACHALGGDNADGTKAGCCRHADMAVFSFHPVKPLTTAEGGAVVTNDDALAERLRSLRTHGIVRGADRVENGEMAEAPWYYEQQELGFNYRMPDVLAALGLSQLKRLDSFIARRRAIARRYDAAFADLQHARPAQAGDGMRDRSGHHLYVLHVDFDALGKDRATVMGELRQRGIGTQVHYIPVHHQPWYRHNQPHMLEKAYPVSEAHYARCLTLPCFPDMTDEDVERVIGAVREVIG